MIRSQTCQSHTPLTVDGSSSLRSAKRMIRFSIFCVLTVVFLCGCATSIQGIRYTNVSQLRDSLLKLTPKDSSPEDVIVVLESRLALKAQTGAYAPWIASAESRAKHPLHFKDNSSLFSNPRFISVYLGEYQGFSFREALTAYWLFSSENKLRNIDINVGVIGLP